VKQFIIDIGNDRLKIKDIIPEQLDRILDWYNMSGEYRYATGIDGPVSRDMLIERFICVKGSRSEFFLGIHSVVDNTACCAVVDNADHCDNNIVGTLMGSVSGSSLWIRLLAIAAEFRGRGLGSMSVSLFLDYMKLDMYVSDVYLSVVENNLQGRRFWLKNGFHEAKRLEKRFQCDGKEFDIIIMQKRL